MTFSKASAYCLVLSLLTACQISISGVPSTTSPVPTSTITASPLTQITETIQPSTYTPKPNPSPSPTNSVPHQVPELISFLSQAWASNALPSTIKAQLEEAGWILYPRFMLGISEGEAFVATDLDGDNQNEWAISIYTRTGGCAIGTQYKEGGELWIIGRGGLLYRLSTKEQDSLWGTPTVISTVDMTGDGLPDLTTRAILCGTHTILGAYHVIGFNNGHYESRVKTSSDLELSAGFVRAYSQPWVFDWSADEIVIPTPNETIRDETGDGIPDLVLAGGTYGSAGAGDVRARTEIWSWTDNEIALSSITWAPTNERFHLLYDANFAFAMKDLDKATILYERIIQDQSLANGVGFGSEADNLAAAQQFAGFRLVLLSAIGGDTAKMARWSQWLQGHYPKSPITEAARMFVAGVQAQKDLANACKLVTEYLLTQETDAPVTGTLSYAGYGNISLTAESVCPLR